MKSLVVYSSLTGHTKTMAEAIFAVLPEPKEIQPADNAPCPEGYDFIAAGFRLDNGTADAKSLRFLESLSGKHVGLFGTLKTCPDADNGRQCINRICELIKGNRICGTVLCQCKTCPRRIAIMKAIKANTNGHTKVPHGAMHLDENDLKTTAEAFTGMAEAVRLELKKKRIV